MWPELVTGVDIDAPEAWLVSEGEPSVVIAVLDTGFPLDHPELNLAPGQSGYDFVEHDADPSPVGTASLDAHGLAVAGLVAAPRNDRGVVGVCPRCTILPVRVLHSNDLERDGDLVAAIRWAAEHADVLNCSWSYDTYAYVPQAVHEALSEAALNGRGGRGTVVVFSAGNTGTLIPAYAPQSRDDVLVVGASDERDVRTSYSSFGPSLDLLAPGGVQDGTVNGERVARAKLVTADLAGDAGNSPHRDAFVSPGIVDDLEVTASFFGTSGAAPLVAGAAGLLLSLEPALTAREVSWILTETSTPVAGGSYDAEGHDDHYGFGRLSVGAALALAQSGAHCHDQGSETCDNGLDDDCDRRTDAADTDCGAASPRPFAVAVGTPCEIHADCGDGMCAPADGDAGARVCAALCDYDCPPNSRCTGKPGIGRCVPSCATDTDCAAGFTCATPAPEALTPGSDAPTALCLPRCDDDADCRDGHCVDGACTFVAPTPESPLEPGLGGGGCDCSTQANNSTLPAWMPLALLGIIGRAWRRRGRTRPTW